MQVDEPIKIINGVRWRRMTWNEVMSWLWRDKDNDLARWKDRIIVMIDGDYYVQE